MDSNACRYLLLHRVKHFYVLLVGGRIILESASLSCTIYVYAIVLVLILFAVIEALLNVRHCFTIYECAIIGIWLCLHCMEDLEIYAIV